MSAGVWTAVIGGVAGLATGAVSALAAPWAKWGVDKRQQTRTRRYELIDSWRKGIANTGGNYKEALGTEWYETLRPYLATNVRDKLESSHILMVVPPFGSGRGGVDSLADEVSRIAREWDLD